MTTLPEALSSADKKETALPWNEQQKWEREGQGAMLNQQRR